MLIDILNIRNLLSFGPKPTEITLGPLNVLIGPNGSGKSNILTSLGLLQSTAFDIESYLRTSGGVFDWAWKGPPNNEPGSTAGALLEMNSGASLSYFITFTERHQQFAIVAETLIAHDKVKNEKKLHPSIYYQYSEGRPLLKRGRRGKPQPITDFDSRKSILAQRRDPELYPELTKVGQLFSQIRFYREWRFGRNAPARLPQAADMPNDYLTEDGSNLGLILNKMKRNPPARVALLENLRMLYAGIEDVDVSIEGNTVQVFIHETGRVIPATRLSDGTLRWLCLLCVLLHPTPPPLVCIEEPELGLHPDLIATLAQLLRSASERMQLVVTTHSDALVDALTDTPESIIVCEKAEGVTACRRLDKKKLKAWLKKYSLGTLWRSGEIGGNRW